MSLWFVLKINDEPVGSLQAQRISNLDTVTLDPDVVSDYRIRIDGKDAGTVQHRYGDSAWALVRTAAELAP